MSTVMSELHQERIKKKGNRNYAIPLDFIGIGARI